MSIKRVEFGDLQKFTSIYDLNQKGNPVNESAIEPRLMKADDLDAVVGIDEKVLKASRPEYYELKFETLNLG
ncbi:hypothetical protein D1BOALGB6SA_3411 [Olavius sp. associated proteobacterium Delta 1]|nr:hypothetical protein D1BOALGB6SA_3411 [Olavius sp. associated proteobacterium Delta 1]